MLLVAVAVLPGLITFVEWGTQSTAYAERVVTAPELSADKGGALQKEAVSLSSSQIEAWRALAVKPALPEEVQRYWVAAKDALENKAFQKAAGYYGKGLGDRASLAPGTVHGRHNRG